MKNVLFALLLFVSNFCLIGQEDSDCKWINKFDKLESIENKLLLVQENLESCVLILTNGIPVSSDTSSFYFGDVKLFINNIKIKEIDSIILLQGDSAKTLYGTAGLNGVILIAFKKKKIMRKVQKRVIKQLRNKSKE